MFRFVALFMAGVAGATPAAVRTVSNLAYRPSSGSAGMLDLYLPDGVKRPPLFVFAHGGAWISGDKDEVAPIGKALASRGVAVALINYRLSHTPDIVYPTAAEDLAAAVAWLLGQESTFPFDSNRVFLGGHSAGAHMIATVATDPRYFDAAKVAADKRPKGYVGVSGIYDIPKLQARYPTYRDWFLRSAFGADEKKWIDASPVRRKFGADQRWLIIHAAGDELVELRQSDDLVAVLRKQKVPVELVVPKGGHFQPVTNLGSVDSIETKAVLGFIDGKPR